VTDAAATEPADEDLTFEQLVEALESLTERMAAGDIGIEAAADLYERAQHLHALAAVRLARVQQRIEGLTPPT
jgi:exodeoxyribonuclease VII small subunit